jgi:integrase
MARRRYQTGCLLIRGKKRRNGKRRKVWVARWREDVIRPDGSMGRVMRSEVLGPVSELPKCDARKLMKTRLRSINRGTHKASSSITFREFALELWEPAILPTLKHTTQRDYRSLLRRHLLPEFGKVRLHDLQRADVQLFLSRKGQQLFTSTVHHLRVLLSQILGEATVWGHLGENVAQGTRLPRSGRSVERRYLTAEQTEQLILSLSEPARSPTLVVALTGLRRGEVFGLRWRWVDFERRLLHIRERIYEGVYDTPKGRPQSIPISDLVYSVLWTRHTSSAYTTPDDLVFCREDGRPLNPRILLEEHIYRTCAQLGLPRVGWHELRHTFCTHLDRSGVSPKTMQSLLRHSKVETTLNVYTHAGLEEQRKAVAKLERVLFPNVPNFALSSQLTH